MEKLVVNTSAKYLTLTAEVTTSKSLIEGLNGAGLISGDRLSLLKGNGESAISDIKVDLEQNTIRVFCIRSRKDENNDNDINEINQIISMSKLISKTLDKIIGIANTLNQFREFLQTHKITSEITKGDCKISDIKKDPKDKVTGDFDTIEFLTK